MSIGNVFTSVKGNFTKYLTKGVGAAALGVVAYDSHIVGKIQADVYSKVKDADACAESFNNTQYLTSPSMTMSKLKDGVNKFELDNNFRHFANSAIGYFKGFGSMLIDDVVPLGLGLGALLTKGWKSKGCAIGLGVYGVFKFFKDVMGFGHYNDLNRKY